MKRNSAKKPNARRVLAAAFGIVALAVVAVVWPAPQADACHHYTGCTDPNLIHDACSVDATPWERRCAKLFIQANNCPTLCFTP